MALIIYDAGPNGMFITVDRQKRVGLNRQTQNELGYSGKPMSLLIAYDPDEKTIGLARPEDMEGTTTSRPITFTGSQAYASARGFISKFQLPCDKTYRYLFERVEGPWHLFKLDENN